MQILAKFSLSNLQTLRFAQGDSEGLSLTTRIFTPSTTRGIPKT